jgi:excisionase family DNA binding protein
MGRDDSPAAGKMVHDLHELLTVDDVAALLKVSRRWVYEHTRKHGAPRSHRLPRVRVGSYVRLEAGAVCDSIARQARIM